MALATVGFAGAVSESAEANRFFRASAPVLADSASSPNVTTSSSTVSVGAGVIQVCGVTVTITGTERVSVSSASPLAVLSVTWAGENSKVSLSAKRAGELVKNPGSRFDVVVAVRTLTGARACLPYGGRAGRLHIPTATGLEYVDAHDGAELVVDDTGAIYHRKATAWVQTDQADSPWRFYDPVLRYSGGGNTQAGVANIGNGGVRRGRYKVENGFVIGEIEIRTGSSGSFFGVGGFTLDTPPGLVPDDYFEDRWLTAHLFTQEEAPMDWCCQGLLKGGQERVRLWAPRVSNDCRMWPAQSKDSSERVNTGVPRINNKFSVPITITVRLFYSIGEDK